jgi:hypothetical protein
MDAPLFALTFQDRRSHRDRIAAGDAAPGGSSFVLDMIREFV